MNRRSIRCASLLGLMIPAVAASCYSGAGEAGGEPCQKDTDCKGERICLDGVCVGGTQTAGGGGTEGEPTRGEPTGGTGTEDSTCFELAGQFVCAQPEDPAPTAEEMAEGTVPPPPGPLPSSAGFSLAGFTVPNQGGCFSCAAFAVRSGMGLRGIVQSSAFTDFSAAHVWSIAGHDDCGQGSYLTQVVSANKQAGTFVVPAATWPYDPAHPQASLDDVPGAAALADAGIAHIQEHVAIGAASSQEVKYAIAQGWPPVISVPVYQDDWQDGHVEGPAEGDKYRGRHAIVVVSYDDAEGAFRFVNSWGTSFGEGGFGTMTYEFVDAHSTGGMALRQLAYAEDADVCGDGVCAGGETQATCCVDCGCPQGSGCDGSICTDESSCGDGTADPDEACDGADLAGASCAGLGFDGGELGCKGDCTLNTSGCCKHECGGGEAICVGPTTVESCGDHDSDACLEYGAPQECDGACSDGACGCGAGDEGQFDVLDHVYPDFGPLGCSGDGSLKLKAAAKMISPTVLRIYVRKSDDSAFGGAATLRLYVGEGPTCPDPNNVEKQSKPLVVGAVEQTFDVTVNPYGASWTLGETKTFWVGKDEAGIESFRATGTLSVKRTCIP